MIFFLLGILSFIIFLFLILTSSKDGYDVISLFVSLLFFYIYFHRNKYYKNDDYDDFIDLVSSKNYSSKMIILKLSKNIF